jgi:NAD(P)-dependent dehydrogenase (short-subunit alcohol dehydrogenase family)
MSSNMFRGKVYTITGAASGMGRATAILLASRGAKVSLCDVQESLLMAAVKEINETEVEEVAMGAVVDIRDRSQVESWISKTVEQFGRLDGAANVAGVTGKDLGVTPLEDVSLRRITFLTSSIANVGSRSMTKTSSSSWTSTSRVH